MARAASLVALAAWSAPASAHADGEAVAWKEQWPRFRWSEGAATVGLVTASLVEDRVLQGPAEPHWTGALLFDNQVRGVLRGRSDHLQRASSRYADIGYRTLSFLPYFDVAIALGVHRSADVALQMFLIDVQSQSFTGSLTLFTKWLVGRQRPYARDCTPNGTVGVHSCGSRYDNISFFSGHTSAAFTGAALTCVHHANLPLYGGGLPDQWACVWAMSVAAGTGLLRIVSDDHYASDVLMAAGVGIFSGYVVPSLLHYGFGSAKNTRPSGLRVVPTLQPVVGGIGVGVAGSL